MSDSGDREEKKTKKVYGKPRRGRTETRVTRAAAAYQETASTSFASLASTSSETQLIEEEEEVTRQIADFTTRFVAPIIVTSNIIMTSYSEYPRRAELHEMMSWYNIRELLETLKAMRKLNFSIVEHRAQALQSLNALEDVAPYARNRRFNEHGLYICEAHGDWIRKFQQIRTSLAIKDHSKDKKSAPGSVGDGTDMNDALLAYYNAVSGLFTQLSQQEFIYDREKFECTYLCVWGQQRGAGI